MRGKPSVWLGQGAGRFAPVFRSAAARPMRLLTLRVSNDQKHVDDLFPGGQPLAAAADLLGWEEAPSVEAPLGDFFCSGWNTPTFVASLPINVNPAGGYNCYFSMPFRKSARITVENVSQDRQTLFYQINYDLTQVR